MEKRVRIRKNKVRRPKELDLINEYYSEALKQLESSNGRIGHEVLYKMPVDLYDRSIDILYNVNDEFPDEELRKLIIKVDNILHNIKEEDPDSDLSDNFNDLF